jgi:uncharacterized membrane protein YdjX (TVP38/TMEM64 family)
MKDPVKRNPEKQKFGKLALYLIIFFVVILFFDSFPPARYFFTDIGTQLENLGILGAVFVIFVNGCFAIPFALPYIVFEVLVALFFQHYWYALTLSVISKVVGCSICFWVAKSDTYREKIRDMLSKHKYYTSMEHLLEQRPLKFSMAFRIILLPFFIKNYGMALPYTITFKTYMTAAMLTTIPYSIINIYICQEGMNIFDLVANSQVEQLTTSLICLGAAFSLVLYVLWYTKRMMKFVEEEADMYYGGDNSKIELPTKFVLEDAAR